MGWYGGTEIFDCVVEDVIFETGNEELEDAIIGNLYDVLRQQDWDTVNESVFFDHPRVQAILKEKDPDWFDDDE